MTPRCLSEDLALSLLHHQPEPVLFYKPVFTNAGAITDFYVDYCNTAADTETGNAAQGLTGQPLQGMAHLNADLQTLLFNQLLTVYTSGEPQRFSYYNPVVQKHISVYRSRTGGGVYTQARNVTAEVQRQQELTAISHFTQSMLDASVSGVFACEAIYEEGRIADLRLLRINQSFVRLLHLTEAVVGKTYRQVFPRSEAAGIFNLACGVISTGVAVRQELFFKGDGYQEWFDVSISKMGGQGVVVSFTPITVQKKQYLQMAEQKAMLDNILAHSPGGITVTEAVRDAAGNVIDFQTIVANEGAARQITFTTQQLLNQTLAQLSPGLKKKGLITQAAITLATGTPFQAHYFMPASQRWMDLAIARLDENRLVNLFTDITESKQAQLLVEKSAQVLKTVFDAAQMGMFIFRPVFDSEGEVTDFRFVMTNPAFAAYVNQTPAVLEGQPGSTWFPGYLTNGVFDMYKHTFITGATNRKEVYYNVDGHDIYLDLQSVKLGDDVFVSFTDHTPLRKAQLEAEKVVEELRRTNANLEEFAYAASHDMQEPIRKILFFSNRIREQYKASLPADALHYFERLEVAAGRMRMLIEDLLAYSQVSMQPALLEEVNLNEKLTLVQDDLELAIADKKATITVLPLPTIKANRLQIQQLFTNLLGNALKYSKPGVAPSIVVGARQVTGRDMGVTATAPELGRLFHEISITDNGIGFDQADAERIFNVFQRLHGNAQYKGTGVGLSIVRKVAENHHGFVTAEGVLGEGSTFKVYLPVG